MVSLTYRKFMFNSLCGIIVDWYKHLAEATPKVKYKPHKGKIYHKVNLANCSLLPYVLVLTAQNTACYTYQLA